MTKRTDAKRIAAAEAFRAFKQASEDQRRATVWVIPRNQSDGHPVDVTEHVVGLLDMIVTSVDWGSDFWSDDDLPSFIELCNLLKIDTSGMKTR